MTSKRRIVRQSPPEEGEKDETLGTAEQQVLWGKGTSRMCSTQRARVMRTGEGENRAVDGVAGSHFTS